MNNKDQSLTDSTSVTALVVALCALLVASAQLLQQYFSSADGYRRCQAAVVGQWAQKTRRRFRWQQGRFEVLFSTPNISIIPMPIQSVSVIYEPSNLVDSQGHICIDDSALSRKLTYSERTITQNKSPETVGWISLLDELHELQRLCLASSVQFENTLYRGCAPSKLDTPGSLTCPAIQIVERSWDLMPPEMIRPVAYTTVSDIIILAHRLGLGWRELRPGREMYAEGNGQSMLASMVRGFGMMLHYTRDKRSQEHHKNRNPWQNVCIPTEAADKLGFGILAGDPELGLDDLSMTTNEDDSLASTKAVMEFLGMNANAREMLIRQWEQTKSLHGFSEIVSLWCPFLPISGSTVRTVMRPLPQIDCGLLWRENRAAFEALLTKRANTSGLDELLRRCVEGRVRFASHWINDGDPPSRRNDVELEYLDWLRLQHRYTTRRLMDLCQIPGSKFDYQTLVAAHLSTSVFSLQRAVSNCKQKSTLHSLEDLQNFGQPYSNYAAEHFFVLVDDLPKIITFMRERGVEDDSVIIEAWWTMIFRGIVWFLSIYMLNQRPNEEGRRGIMVPSSLWGSRAPVYIA